MFIRGENIYNPGNTTGGMHKEANTDRGARAGEDSSTLILTKNADGTGEPSNPYQNMDDVPLAAEMSNKYDNYASSPRAGHDSFRKDGSNDSLTAEKLEGSNAIDGRAGLDASINHLFDQLYNNEGSEERTGTIIDLFAGRDRY